MSARMQDGIFVQIYATNKQTENWEKRDRERDREKKSSDE